MPSTETTKTDLAFLQRAVTQALAAEKRGNLPIGAVITLDGQVIAAAGNAMRVPHYHPGRHAEIEALKAVPVELWPRAAEMTCYSTLEPCVMCTGTILLHGIGRVVFGALDQAGGGGCLLPNLPPYYDDRNHVPVWIGPALPDVCDALAARAFAAYAVLPKGSP